MSGSVPVSKVVEVEVNGKQNPVGEIQLGKMISFFVRMADSGFRVQLKTNRGGFYVHLTQVTF